MLTRGISNTSTTMTELQAAAFIDWVLLSSQRGWSGNQQHRAGDSQPRENA